MTEHKIDNVALTYPPSHVTVIEPEIVPYPGPGLGKVNVQPRVPPIVEWHWGLDVQRDECINELLDARGQRICHMISWTDDANVRLNHRNVGIPFIGAAYGPKRDFMDPFTLKLEEFRPMPALALVELTASGITGSAFLAVGDGQAKWEAEAGGQIWGIGGYIEGLGTGAGGTTVQISNGATDYLSTRGDFLVASATNLMENAVRAAGPRFDRGAVLELDIDAVPAGADSSNLHVFLYVLIYAV